MRSARCNILFCSLLVVPLLPSGLFGERKGPPPSPLESTIKFNWRVVVNNGVMVPNDGRNFNSYNEPSVNVNQLVVFRARSKGGMGGEPAHGVFIRNMAQETPVITVFDRTTSLPQPNNLGMTFREPPSFPRIDLRSDTIASRGNHGPAWRSGQAGGFSETRAGTTGIYTNPFGILIAGASNLGETPGFSIFGVPGLDRTKFDVFPGTPAVTDGATIVFKGNYSVPDLNNPGKTVGRTGAYFRDLLNAPIQLPEGARLGPAGGNRPIVVIADSDTLIPGTSTKFGSVAPPGAADRYAVFAGFDNEENPTKGGIYLAELHGPRPPLTPLVNIGSPVPGEKKGPVFNRLGEGISFDGRFVAFWGAWGAQTMALILQCPAEGNKVRNAYCREQYPQGFEATLPVHQGIFIVDTKTGKTHALAKAPDNFADFVYWKFSGYVEGMGMGESEDASEPARWRSGSFVAVSGLVDGKLTDANFHAIFKARRGQLVNGAYADPVDGIYLVRGPGKASIVTVVNTGMDGTLIDPEAVGVDETTGATAVLPVTELGIERDGFRGSSIVISAGMGTEEAGWAGIYLTEVPDGLIQKGEGYGARGRGSGRH